MKTVRKQIDILNKNLYVSKEGRCFNYNQFYKLELKSLDRINTESLELTHEVEVPETIGEFKRLHGLSRDELVDWLNDNYEKM